MFEAQILRVISSALKNGFHQPYSDELAAELGLTWDRWFVSRYAGNPGIASEAMADYLLRLSLRLGCGRVQQLLAEESGE